VLLIPIIRVIKKQFTQAKITVLAERRNASTFQLCPEVDQILLYDRLSDLIAVLRTDFDVVIDTEQWHRLSAVVARLTRAPLLIGYATNERARLFTHPVAYGHENYERDSFSRLVEPLGIHPEVPDHAYLTVSSEAAQTADMLLKGLDGKPFVAIFPGASIPERRWGAGKYGEVAARFHRHGIPIVVIGGKEDVSDGEKIVAGKFGLNLTGKTSLVETAAVINKSALLVSADSGILHIGVGLDKPTVSLFGPGIAKKWAPRGDRHIVLNKGLTCSPCTSFGNTPECPINEKCMAEISVEEVVAAVEKLMGKFLQET